MNGWTNGFFPLFLDMQGPGHRIFKPKKKGNPGALCVQQSRDGLLAAAAAAFDGGCEL